MWRLTRYIFIIFLFVGMITTSVLAFQADKSKTSSSNSTPNFANLTREHDIENQFLKDFLARNNIRSIEAYVKWFRENMHYESDGGVDDWSSPSETIARRRGDCEDLAFLNKAILDIFGLDSVVIGTQKGSAHHVFCVFKRNSHIYIFDNTRFIKTKAKSLDQIGIFLYNKYDIDYLLEVQLNPKSISVLYTKPMLQRFVKTSPPLPSS